jgi:hypothetical protein
VSATDVLVDRGDRRAAEAETRRRRQPLSINAGKGLSFWQAAKTMFK